MVTGLKSDVLQQRKLYTVQLYMYCTVHVYVHVRVHVHVHVHARTVHVMYTLYIVCAVLCTQRGLVAVW